MNSRIFIGGSIAIILAVIFVKLYQFTKHGKSRSKEQILEECFGVPTYVSTLSLTDVRDWIKARGYLLTTNSKAVVLKVNDETLKSIGKDLGLCGSADNYLIIAIVDESEKGIKASSLVKYEYLENQLNKMLENGKGVLVIER